MFTLFEIIFDVSNKCLNKCVIDSDTNMHISIDLNQSLIQYYR